MRSRPRRFARYFFSIGSRPRRFFCELFFDGLLPRERPMTGGLPLLNGILRRHLPVEKTLGKKMKNNTTPPGTSNGFPSSEELEIRTGRRPLCGNGWLGLVVPDRIRGRHGVRAQRGDGEPHGEAFPPGADTQEVQ